MWYYYGSPTGFFTVTPCDKWSFRVRSYATSQEYKLPILDNIKNQTYCLLDLKSRNNLRAKYPGACALEYGNILQIVINVLIGWNKITKIETNQIFGVPLVFTDCCKE